MELILIYVHTKTNDIKSHKQKGVFSFFLSCRWIICLVRNRSLNLHIFVFRSGYSRKRVKRLQNLQKEHTPKQLGTWILFLLPSGLVLSGEKIWLGLEIDPAKSRMLFSQCYKFVYVGTISVHSTGSWGGSRFIAEGIRWMGGPGASCPGKFWKFQVPGNTISAILRQSQTVLISHF